MEIQTKTDQFSGSELFDFLPGLPTRTMLSPALFRPMF